MNDILRGPNDSDRSGTGGTTVGTGIVRATRHGSPETLVLKVIVKPGKQEDKMMKDGTMQKPKHDQDHQHTRLGAALGGPVLTTPMRMRSGR